MRATLRVMRSLVAAAVLAATASTAAAQAVIVKGGPASRRDEVELQLAEAAAAMNVCWRGKPPAKVKVKLDVGPDGLVRATGLGKSGAAQCAAGVLAVWRISGGPWSGEVEITAGSADVGAVIQQGLLARSASIKACQSKAPTAAGPVAIKMKIHPDGTITDVVASSSLGAAINGCVQKSVAAIRLDPLAAAAPINYALSVAFAGTPVEGGAPGGGGPVSPVEDPEGGNVAGPLGAEQVKPVMSAARAKLVACGKKGKAKGTVVTRFTVRPDGTTKNVVVKEPIGDAAIETCLVGVFKTLKFPASAGETKVSYPVAFK